MNYLLVALGALSAVVIGLLGLLIYASPNSTDQLAGKLVIAAALAIVLLTLFHRNIYVAWTLGLMGIATLIFLLWLVLKWFK